MATAELGKLERVDVRKAWEDEAQDFTPWLADNLNFLAAELGLELELEETEKAVGRYRADILALVSQTDERVLIENQLGRADLQHLGQVLAYLAGLEAKIVVWIATDFRDEHLSAIRWLNEQTMDPFAFFAVKISAVQIGDSLLAPIFEVLERPNEWDRQVQVATRPGRLSERGVFQREFWAHCLARWKNPPKLRPNYALPHVWHTLVPESGLRVVMYVSKNGTGVYLGGRSDKEDKAQVQARAKLYRESLRESMGLENFLSSNNADCRSVLDIDSHDRSNWDRMADWLDDARQRYEEILREGRKNSEIIEPSDS